MDATGAWDEWCCGTLWIIVVYANGDETVSYSNEGVRDTWWLKSGLARW